MKKLAISILMITTNTAQIFWQNPYPQGNNLNEICIVTKETIIAVGDFGSVIRSSDTGSTWELLNFDTNYYFNSIAFADESNGWIVGTFGTIYHTNNAGKTWIQQNSNSTKNLNSIFCNNDGSIWIVGSEGIILYSDNLGNTWNLKQSNTTDQFSAINFVNTNYGWIIKKDDSGIGPSSYLFTTDAGVSWENKTDQWDIWGNDIQFINENIGALVRHWRVAYTTNSGISWNNCSVPDYDYRSIYFSDLTIGWIVGGTSVQSSSTGVLLKTEDSGINWIEKSIYCDVPLNSIDFFNNNIGFICGVNGTIYRTQDGGDVWERLTPANSFYDRFYDVHFTSNDVGCVVGIGNIQQPNGVVLYTENAGTNWETVYTNDDQILNSIFFVDSETGYSVGNEGLIIKTEDGGHSWSEVDNFTDKGLRDIYFLNEELGWIVGYNGTIYKTEDRGANWISFSLDDTLDNTLESIFFLDSLVGFTCSSNGMLKSTDGGENWFKINDLVMNDVIFINESKGWTAGYAYSSGYFYITEDGGNNWTEVLMPNNRRLFSLCFIDSNNGYAVGPDGYIFKTSDGGYNWEFIQFTTKSLFSSFFVNQNTGWIVGMGGTILKIENGNITSVNTIESYSNSNMALYHLNQNYPNPFNPNTIINYNILQISFVTIKVYDVLGNEITTLVNEEKPAGEYNVEFRVDNLELSSGIYFYQLRVGQYVETKKMVLLK